MRRDEIERGTIFRHSNTDAEYIACSNTGKCRNEGFTILHPGGLMFVARKNGPAGEYFHHHGEDEVEVLGTEMLGEFDEVIRVGEIYNIPNGHLMAAVNEILQHDISFKVIWAKNDSKITILTKGYDGKMLWAVLNDLSV